VLYEDLRLEINELRIVKSNRDRMSRILENPWRSGRIQTGQQLRTHRKAGCGCLIPARSAAPSSHGGSVHIGGSCHGGGSGSYGGGRQSPENLRISMVPLYIGYPLE